MIFSTVASVILHICKIIWVLSVLRIDKRWGGDIEFGQIPALYFLFRFVDMVVVPLFDKSVAQLGFDGMDPVGVLFCGIHSCVLQCPVF